MKSVLLFASLSILAACDPSGPGSGPGPWSGGPVARVDFQYSRSSGLGIQNAGRYPAGTVFVWNRRDNSLVHWTDVTLPLKATSGPSDGKSSNVSGFELDANLSGLDLKLEALIGRAAEFEATGVVRKDYEKGPKPLRDHVRAMDPEDQAALVETLGTGDTDVKVVVVTTVFEVTTSKFLLGGIDATAGRSVGKITLSAGDSEIGNVDVKLASDLSCGASAGAAGGGAPCFIDVTVYDVSADPSGTSISFRQGLAAPDGLPSAFRSSLKGS